jgi:hypothetical protein
MSVVVSLISWEKPLSLRKKSMAWRLRMENFFKDKVSATCPKKFSNGIIQGKLMAKEYEGILLLIATIL